MSEIQFNNQQLDAINKAVAWYKAVQDRRTLKKHFLIGGFAGTGKTSIAKEIVKRCCGEYGAVYVAPTGKAAARLKQKGCYNAQTLHKFIYNVRGEDEDGEPIFVGKDSLDERPKLIVLDEGSMVGLWDMERLLSWGIPVLMLGDIGQVPPVKSEAFFIEERLDVLLTEIMRQSQDSNIIRASFFVRQGKRLPVREYDDVVVSDKKPTLVFLKQHMGADSQIICSYNSTRFHYNKMLRKICGYEERLPIPGEKIVCTFNQHGPGFMNGEQGIVLRYEDVPDFEREDDEPPQVCYVVLQSLTEDREVKIKFNPLCFDDDESVRAEAHKKTGGVDFGYVITIHKSQGSEWDNVIVLEEILKGVPYSKMMYTAVTRAIRKLWVFRA